MDLITVNRKEGLAFEVGVREHRVACDMAPRDGGEGSGFAPAELLAGSLGACIAMVVQRYCDESGHGDGDVSVSLTYELRDEPKRIGGIVVDIELPEGVPANRANAVRRAAEQCVIHHTLRNPPEVNVDIVS